MTFPVMLKYCFQMVIQKSSFSTKPFNHMVLFTYGEFDMAIQSIRFCYKSLQCYLAPSHMKWRDRKKCWASIFKSYVSRLFSWIDMFNNKFNMAKWFKYCKNILLTINHYINPSLMHAKLKKINFFIILIKIYLIFLFFLYLNYLYTAHDWTFNEHWKS